jgi:endonuclease YncB( thermonuclease family)
MTRPDAPATPQERVRALVRAEVARARPRESSRNAIELIVESAARASADGVVVLDARGEPRFLDRNGGRVPFTVADLVEQLRQQHPRLFESADPPPAPPTPRDWLTLVPPAETKAQPGPAPEPPKPPAAPVHVPPLPAAAISIPPEAPAVEARPGRPAQTRRRLGRWPVAAGLAALAVPLAAALLLARGAPNAPAPPPQAAAPPAIRNTAPAERDADAAPPTADRTAVGEREPGATGAVATAARGPVRGVPEVLDTTTLSVQGQVVRLFGVEWARGAGDPEDLARYIRGRPVACTPVAGSEAYRCEVDGKDLSRVVLFNGGGRATPEATPDLKAAEDQARTRHVGLWAGALTGKP